MDTSAPTCAWTAALNANYGWIDITGGSSGTGDGSVNYFVGGNGGGARSATMTVAGKTVTVNQAAHP